MKHLTRAQQAAMIKADKQGPIVTIPVVTARALIDSGYMQEVSVSPKPTKGITVALTIKGKSWIKSGGAKNTG